MRKPLNILLLVIAALLCVIIAAAAIFAARFNPNDYKPLLIRMVQEKKQRTLAIPGDIRLSFFPRLGIALGKASLSERDGNREFASVGSAKVSLALMPLLSRRYVIDKVHVDGLRASIVRYKDGTTNIDDLLSPDAQQAGQPPSGQADSPLQFDIDGVQLRNAWLSYDDRQADRRLVLSNVSLDSGRIAGNTPSTLELGADLKGDKPVLAGNMKLKTGFSFNLAGKRAAVKDLDGRFNGGYEAFTDLAIKLAGNADVQWAAGRFVLDNIRLDAAGKRSGQPLELKLDVPQLAITDHRVAGKLSGRASMIEGARAMAINFNASSFDGTARAFRLPALEIDATVKDAKLDIAAKIRGAVAGDIDALLFSSPQLGLNLSGKQGTTAISGTLTTPFALNLKTQVLDLPHISAAFSLPNPAGGALALKAAGSANMQLRKKIASAVLNGSLDESAFNAKLGLAQFSPAAYTFDIGVDKLDIDRYLAKPAQPIAAPASAQDTSGASRMEQPIDLSALRDLQANGSMRIGALKVKNLRTANVRFDMHAGAGKLDISPLSANLYGGSVQGSMSVATTHPARFAMRQNLMGIDVGPLLKDVSGKNPIEGKGNVQFDVAAAGRTFTELRKTLNGNARLMLHDGAVRGVNIAQAVRSAKARIGELRGDAPAQGGTASTAEKTDFSELAASFRIVNGIAHNDDLNIKSPLLRIGGAGDINLAAQRLDYLVRTTVVSTLQGQGGPELQALKGLTVPVKLAGPFEAIDWRIDFSGMARELAQQKIDQKKEEVRSKAQKAIDEQKAKVQEQLQDKLKGLFGK